MPGQRNGQRIIPDPVNAVGQAEVHIRRGVQSDTAVPVPVVVRLNELAEEPT